MLCKMPAACEHFWNWLLETKGSQVLQGFFYDPGCVWSVLIWRSINWLDLELQTYFVVGRTEGVRLLSVQDHPLSPHDLSMAPHPLGCTAALEMLLLSHSPSSELATQQHTLWGYRLVSTTILGMIGTSRATLDIKRFCFDFSGVKALSSWAFIPQGLVTCTGVLRAKQKNKARKHGSPNSNLCPVVC